MEVKDRTFRLFFRLQIDLLFRRKATVALENARDKFNSACDVVGDADIADEERDAAI